ncbi:MAG: hypothetical protein QOE37_583 [Microbacteriaceae bacterium]|jgi:hypothetical protein|nr:hypothetical protein [Microbacteriaceae bacterium]
MATTRTFPSWLHEQEHERAWAGFSADPEPSLP